MAAHRYWRARGLLAYDGGASVDLSEFWLIAAGVRVDTSATLTSSVAPTVGSLSSLSDDDTATGCTLSTTSVLTWDFDPTPADVDDIRLGSADAFGKFLRFCLIEWSDDGTAWTDYDWGDQMQRPHSFGWPGNRTLTASVDPAAWDILSAAYAKDPADGKIIISSGDAGRAAVAKPFASTGVRQFETTCSSWGTPFKSLGVGDFGGNASQPSLATGWAVFPNSNEKSDIGSSGRAAWTASGPWLSTDVIGIVIDFTGGNFTVYKNGVSVGVPFTSMAGRAVRPATDAGSGSDTTTLRTNDFAYPIAGAEPWTRAIIAPGAPTVGLSVTVISNGGHEAPYSGAIFIPEHRARPNFIFDPAARGRIIGTVKRKSDPSNIPLKRRVRLYRDRDGMFIREGWSNTVGDYVFEYVEENEAYTVLAHDYQFNYRAVVADNLTLANGGVELI